MRYTTALVLALLLVLLGCGKRATTAKPGGTSVASGQAALEEAKPVIVELKVGFTADRKDYVLLAEDDITAPDYKGCGIYLAKDKVSSLGAKDNEELMDRYYNKKIHVTGVAVRKSLECRDAEGNPAKVERMVVEVNEPSQLKIVD
jgi:hypothetical protein